MMITPPLPMQLWRRAPAPAGGRGSWSSHAIPDGGLAFAVGAGGALFVGDAPGDAELVAHLVPVRVRGVREAALVLAPDAQQAVLVGGYPPLGVALVGDRSELRVGAERLYVTRAAAASAERFDGADAGASCARCTRALRRGDAALRCANCGAWHHEGPRAEGERELLCASYDPQCGACHVRFDELSWTPEALE